MPGQWIADWKINNWKNIHSQFQNNIGQKVKICSTKFIQDIHYSTEIPPGGFLRERKMASINRYTLRKTYPKEDAKEKIWNFKLQRRIFLEKKTVLPRNLISLKNVFRFLDFHWELGTFHMLLKSVFCTNERSFSVVLQQKIQRPISTFSSAGVIVQARRNNLIHEKCHIISGPKRNIANPASTKPRNTRNFGEFWTIQTRESAVMSWRWQLEQRRSGDPQSWHPKKDPILR